MNLKQRYQQFKEWQQQPYQVAPLSQEEHTCATCGTTYQGNYCPRCGQSYRIGRYSLKSAMLLLLDVWGLGNRGMFRSIRDLLLRPGYMIRDYLGGMQMAYFPPFKMFFLLATLSLLVDSGFNIKGENKFEEVMESYQADFDKDIQKKNTTQPLNEEDAEKDKVAKEVITKVFDTTKAIIQFVSDHQTIVELVWLLVLSLPLFTLFRGCPAIPDLNYPEFFVAMVYITNMMNIVSAVASFFCVEIIATGLLSPLLSIVALKQLSGYSYLRTTLSVLASFLIIMWTVVIGLILLGIVIGFLKAYYAQ